MADDSAILDWLRSGETLTAPQEPPLLQDPMAARIAEATRQKVFSPEEERARFVSENKAPNVPLDIDSGAGWWQRVQASQRTDPEQQIKFWQDLYGEGRVRLATKDGRPTGGLIVSVLDEVNGKPKDMLVDEKSLTARDFMEFISGTGVETAGAILGSKGARAIPFIGKQKGVPGAVRDILAGTAGAEGAGTLKDISVRASDEMPIGNVVSRRAGQAVTTLPLAAGLHVLGAGIGRMITPYPTGKALPAIQQEGKQAQEYFEQRFNEEFKYSAGERTGNMVLQRAESGMERLPGAGKGFQDLRQQQEASFQRIANKMVGLPAEATAAERAAMMSAEEIGELGILQLRTVNNPLDSRISVARQQLLERTQFNIEQAISSATLPQRMLYQDSIGTHIRAGVKKSFNTFKAESDLRYDAAMSLPGGRDRILVAPTLSKDAATYLTKELPQVKHKIETESGLLDYLERPVVTTTFKETPATEFIPSGVTGKLKQLAETDITEFSLQDLVAMRNEVMNDIKVGEAVKGVQTHHLGKIKDMLTKSINESTGALPNGALKKAWMDANEHYAKEVGKFHTPLISSILKPPNAPGYVGDATMVRRIVSGEDKITEIKGFLGSSSKEYAMLKRGIADSVYENALIPGTTRLDGNTFLKSLTDFRANNRRAFDEVFGSAGDSLIQQSKQMTLGRQGIQLETAVIEAGISNPRSMPRLYKLIEAERAKTEAYKNGIRKAVGSGQMPGDLNPGDFVSRFLNSASPKEAKAAMNLLSPDLQQAVRAKTAENLLWEASRTATAMDRAAFRLDPNRIVASERLQNLIGNPDKQRLYETILGPQSFKDLEMMARLLRPIEAKQGSFRTASGISAGMSIAGLAQGNISGFADKSLKTWLASQLLMNVGPAWVGNRILSEGAQSNLRVGAVATAPMLKSLLTDFGAAAEDAASKVNRILNAPTQPSQTNVPSDEAILQFLRQ